MKMENRWGRGVLTLGVVLWSGMAGVMLAEEVAVEAWARELLMQTELRRTAGEVRHYPSFDEGAGWEYCVAEDPRAAWYAALLWEAAALTGASDLAVAAKVYAEEALGFVVEEGVPGGGPMQAGQGEGLSRWAEMDWQERPPEDMERYLASMEGRWMPELGAFWHTAVACPRSPDGLSGGWKGRDNTSLASLVEMASLWEVATVAGALEWQARARSHVAWVLQQHLRTDGGTVERVVHDGEILATAQSAYSGETTLARSHALGMLGLARWARLTGERGALEAFDRMYRYVRQRMPGPLPPWDLEAADLSGEQLSLRFLVDPVFVERGAIDSGAAALLALALAEAVPLVVEGRGWEYFMEAGRLLAAVEAAGSGVAAWGGSRSLVASVHGTWPGDDRGDIVADYAYIRAKRLLFELEQVEPRLAEAFALPMEVSLRVTEAQPWRVGADAGALALHYQSRIGTEPGGERFCLLEGRVWTQFTLSLLLWPDRDAFRPDRDALLVFGYKSAEDYHLLTLGPESGSIRLEQVKGAIRTLLAEVAGGLPGAPAFNEVRLEGAADGLVLEIGGDERMRLALSAETLEGMVGFGATGPFWFDDVVVSGTSVAGDLLPMDAWRETAFPERFSVAAWDDSDPDGDGRNNLLEYAMGSNPLNGDHSGRGLSLGAVAGFLQIAFPLEPQGNDVAVELQSSSDGGSSWDAVDEPAVALPLSGWQRVTVEAPSVGAGACLFRLFVSRQGVE